MRLVHAVAVLSLPLGLVVGCGGDDDVESAPAGDERSERDLAADQELVDHVVLTLDDLGAGWSVVDDEEEDEPEDEAEDELLGDELAECLGVNPDDFPDEEGDDPEAGATFEQEDTEIESSVAAAPTAELPTRFLEVFASESFPACYEELLGDELQRDSEADDEARDAGVTYRGVQVDGLQLPDDLGDQATGIRATISIDAQGVPLDSYQYLYFARRGRVGFSLTAISTFEPLSEELMLRLLRVMDMRAANA